MTSQAMCSAAWPARPAAAEPSITDLRQIGHFVMSSGHSWGAIERGASQNLEHNEAGVILIISNLQNSMINRLESRWHRKKCDMSLLHVVAVKNVMT